MKKKFLRIPVIAFVAMIIFSLMPFSASYVNAASPTYTAPVKITQYALKKGKLKKSGTYTLKYNKRGYITTIKVGKKTRDKFKYSFRSNGTLSKVIHQDVYYSFSNMGMLTNFDSKRYHEVYHRDSNNRIVKYTHSDNDIVFTYEYTYYPEGGIHTVTEYVGNDKTNYTVVTLDKNGLITQVNDMRDFGDKHVPYIRYDYVYSYDKKGRITSVDAYRTYYGKKTKKIERMVLSYKKSKTKLAKFQYDAFITGFTNTYIGSGLGAATTPNGLDQVYADIEFK